MQKTKKTAFGQVARRTAIVACIIMLAVFGVTAGNDFFTKDAEPFVLVVNAAEGSADSELNIGETLTINASTKSHSIGTNENDDGYYCINIPIKFEGDNINSITYSINKGGFQIVEKKGASIVCEGNEINEINAGQTGGGPGCEIKYYSNFTLDYNQQGSEEAWINITRDGIPLSDGGHFIAAENPAVKDLEKGYRELLDDVVITCDVNFDDGTTESVNLKVGSVIDNNIMQGFTLERVN